MNVQSWLLLLVPSLAAIGTLVLSLGQPQRPLTILALFAIFCAGLFTDYLRWFRLPTIAANIAAIAAVMYTMSKFSNDGSESQLISVADLLIYLQIVLLFQSKSLRIYWQIFLLSLLEVVVAAALSLGLQFGMLMILYMFLALATATLLFVRSESTSTAFTPDHAGSQPGKRPSSVQVRARHRVGPEPEDLMLNRQLVWRICCLGTSTLIFMTFLFFLLPRFGDQPKRTFGDSATRTVGFAPRIRLGEVGHAMENPEIVMRAQFTTAQGKPFAALTEPYFRGSVLSQYRRGLWMDDWKDTFLTGDSPLAPAPASMPVVHQTVVLESGEELFSVAPIYAMPGEVNESLGFDAYRQLLIHRGDHAKTARRYKVATSAFRNGMQRKLYPLEPNSSWERWRLAELLRFRAEFFPGLKQKADEVVAKAGLKRGEHRAIAKALETHFLTSPDYTYSLKHDWQRPYNIDPIEFFVTQQRSGHCEYFASALAMMLRSQGIPSRLVLGFRGGEYNAMGHYFLVRQLHAHAWVEAYLEPQQVEPAYLLEGETATAGAWMTLDPTPGNDAIVALDPVGWRQRWSHLGDFLELLWKDYVVGLNSSRQRKAIYVPLVESTSASMRGVLLNPDWWRSFFSDLVTRLGLDSIDSFREKWITWRSIPLLAAVFFGCLLVRRLAIFAWRRSAPFRQSIRRRRTWTRDPQLQWYARLERSLAREGHRRKIGQTPREFLAGVVDHTSTDREMKTMADRLIEEFYRIRFGHNVLGGEDIHALEQIAHTFAHSCKEKVKHP